MLPTLKQPGINLMLTSRLLLAFLVFTACQSATAQTMYRCGNSFSQTPCGPEAKKINIALQGGSQQYIRVLKDDATKETKAKSLALCTDAVRAKLKDPESARVSGMVRSNSLERQLPVLTGPIMKTSGFYGYVNGKNSMGGYTGDMSFTCSVDYATESTVLEVLIN